MLSTFIGLTLSLFGGTEITYAYGEPTEHEVVLIEVKEKTIEEKIRDTFPDAPIMVEVARCESGIQNIKGKLSDDYGVFQINYVHLEDLKRLGLDRTDIDDNIKFARILYDERGLKPWSASENCWGKYRSI